MPGDDVHFIDMDAKTVGVLSNVLIWRFLQNENNRHWVDRGEKSQMDVKPCHFLLLLLSQFESDNKQGTTFPSWW